MALPLVSIGIPTYNRPEGLARALASALAQTYQPLEIIVSDNASEPAVVVPAGVRLIRQITNRGAEANFRSVLDAATGEYFMWLADDDWIDSNYVTECVGYLIAHPEYSLAAGGSSFGDVTNVVHTNPAERVALFYDSVAQNSAFYGLARRDLWRTVMKYSGLAADWYMMADLAFAGPITTLEQTTIHRSRGGASHDVASMVHYYKLTGRAGYNPHYTIVREAAAQTYAYGGLRLAVRVYLRLFERWCMWDTQQPGFWRRVEIKLHRWAIAWMHRNKKSPAWYDDDGKDMRPPDYRPCVSASGRHGFYENDLSAYASDG